MAQGNVTAEELAALLGRTADAAKAYIRGDMRTYFTLIRHGDDFTLMAPFGGEVVRGVDTSPERLEALERYFQSGEAELEVVETYASAWSWWWRSNASTAKWVACRTRTGRCA